MRGRSVQLYHTTPARNLTSIYRLGLSRAFSRDARRSIWLHTESRSRWAADHTRKRHGQPRVVRIRVVVDRSEITRRGDGVWTYPATIPPDRIVSVSVVPLIAATMPRP